MLRLRSLRFVAAVASIAAFAGAVLPRALAAQADTGRVETLRLVGVIDDKTGDWIDHATVRDTLGDETYTTRFGVATLNVLTPIAGFYLLEIRKEGYAPRRLRLRADTSYQLMFRLAPNPLGNATQLPTVVVTEQQRLQYDAGERRGFFERCQIKTVQCVGRADLDKDPTGVLYNMLRTKDGVHPECLAEDHGPVWNRSADVKYDDTLFGCLVTMHSSIVPPEYCTPTFFVDGFEWLPVGGRPQSQIDQFLPPKRIEGIEVYLASQPTPPRFAPAIGSGCGSIVIWTR